nr:hypothetical protein [uncultured Rhodoferax sp.]
MDQFDQAAATVAGDNPFDSAAAGVVGDIRTAARTNLYGALLSNPDMAARAQSLGKRTGIPADVVERNLPEVQRTAQLSDLDKVLDGSPVVAQWVAADAARAKLASDDIENMGTVERLSRQFFGSAGENVGRSLHGFGTLLDIAERRVTSTIAGLILPEPQRGPMGIKPQQPTVESLRGPTVADDWRTVGADTMQYYRENVLLPADKQTFGDRVVGGIGQVASQVLMSPVDRGAGLYAQGASIMAEKVQGDNASQDAKDLAVVGGAAVTGITERWALDKLLGPLAVPVKNKIGAALARIGIAAASEGAQEFSENVLQDLIQQALTNPDHTVDLGSATGDASVGAAVGGIVRSIVESALHVRVRGEQRMAEAQKAERDAKAVEVLATLSGRSKLRERSPEAFEQFVTEATQGSALRDVFISAQTLAQSPKAREIAAASPSVAEQLPAALESGGDVRIPVGEFAAQIAGNGYAQDLINELKTEPDGMTRTQAQEFASKQTDAMNQEIDMLAAEQSQDLTNAEQAKAIQMDLAAKLNEAGRFSPSVNQAYAQLPAAFFETMAKRLGGTPAQLYAEYGPTIVAQGVTGPMLSQDAQGGFVPREFTQDGKPLIGIFKGADLSTFLHESGHFFLESYADMAKASPVLQGDMQTLLDWFGVQDLNTWQGMDLDAKRAGHEQFARGFEAYLAEGTAPSLELRSLFSRFRDWLSSVYRNIKGLNVNLSPEVRAVMDRMLASDEHIQTAQRARGLVPLFNGPEQAAQYGVNWDQYQTLEHEATAAAVNAMEARSVRDMAWSNRLREDTIKRLNKDAKAKRDEVMGEVAAEVMLDPVYQVQRWLKKGVLPDGSQTVGAKLSTVALAEMYGDGPATPRRYLATNLVSADGLHPDEVAGMFGFKSGDEMVRKIVDALPFRAQVDALTDQRTLEKYGDITSPQTVARAADEAIHNDVRTRFLATELAGLQKAVGSAQALARAAKEYAAKMIERAKVGQLRPTQFAAAEVRAGKAAEDAMRKGDTAEAIQQKRYQIINHTATGAAYQAQDEIQKTLAFFRTVAAGGIDKRNADIVNAARAILATYGVGMRGKNPRQYMEAVKAYDPELFAVMEPMLQDAEENSKVIEQLTVGELRALRDNVESLWYLSRREKLAEIDGQLVDRDAINEALVKRLEVLGVPDKVPGEGRAVTEGEKVARKLMGVRAALRRTESWADRMDGGDISGAFRKYLFTPISEAADRYRADAGTYLARYRDLLKAIEPTLTRGRIAAPELGYTFGFSKGDAGKAELLHALLHTGNESNKRKLLLGRGWAVEIADGVLDTSRWDSFVSRMINEGKLTKADFDFAQGVWNLLEEIKPLAQKTHRAVFGRYFDEITASPFTNQFGNYEGGYVPAITDTFEVQDAAINAELDAANANNAYMFPATSRGFTKARVEYNKPLALDLRLIPQHIDKALLFSHMEPHVRDVTRTLRAKPVATTLNRYDPVAYTDLLLPWLNRAAKQTVDTPATGWGGKLADQFFRTARSRAGMTAMFANFTNAFQQITGLSMSALKVNPANLKGAAWRYMRAPGEVSATVAELSPFMASRMDNQTMHMRQEIDDLLINPNKYQKLQAYTNKHAYFLQSAFQNVVDVITWSGAFDQATAEGMAQADAVRTANAAVRATQGSLSPEDVSRVETGPAFVRLFTQFTGYFNMQANLLGTESAKVIHSMGLKRGAGPLLYVFLLGLLVPAWFSEAIVQGMRGGPDDDEGDGYLDEFLAAFFGAPARNVAAMVPVAGQSAVLLANSFNGKPYDDRMSTAPAVSMLESAAQAPHSIYKAVEGEGKASRAIRDTLTLISLVTGIPVAALGKPLGYGAEVVQGNVTPTGPVDTVRGAISGAASPESKR